MSAPFLPHLAVIKIGYYETISILERDKKKNKERENSTLLPQF